MKDFHTKLSIALVCALSIRQVTSSFNVEVKRASVIYDPLQRFAHSVSIPEVPSELLMPLLEDCKLKHPSNFLALSQNLSAQNNGLSYTASLLFGSEQVAAELVYDTGSGYLTVSDLNCDTCTNKLYSSTDSNSSSASNDQTTHSLAVRICSITLNSMDLQS